MVTYKCIIIDDEKQAINALKHELSINCSEIEIIGEASDIKTAVVEINSKKPHIIFLDIQLTDGLGFEILEQIGSYDLKVIFTTAYSEYAIKAFQFNAIDYLLKPIDGNELKRTIHKLLQIENNELKKRIDNLLLNQNTIDPNKKIAIPLSDGVHLFPIKTISRLNSERNYTQIYFIKGKMILSAKTLKDFEEMLSSYQFMRVHQSHIVNLSHIKSYINKDGGYILMEDKSIIPIAARKKSEFLEALKKI